MANRNGKGPEGKGPRTGRGLGNCKTVGVQQENTRPRNGRGRNFRFRGD